MNTGGRSTPPEPDSAGVRDLRRVLDEIDQILLVDVRRRAEEGGVVPDTRLPALLAELEEAVEASPEQAARLARRLRAVRARLALGVRDVPAGTLDGLYDEVCAETDAASPWARSRMSDAFLDAPRDLVRWRSTALAACALLALGAGLFAGGGLGFEEDEPGRALERMDMRNALLPRLDAPTPRTQPRLRGRSNGTFVSTPGEDDRARERRGFYVWFGTPREPAEAQRRLDAVGVRVFPVGRTAGDVESN